MLNIQAEGLSILMPEGDNNVKFGPKLTKISFCSSLIFPIKKVVHVLESCMELKNLSLNLVDTLVDDLNEFYRLKLIFKNLVSLDVNFGYLKCSAKKVASMIKFLQSSKSLENLRLYLSTYDNLNEIFESLQAVAPSLLSLRSLNLGFKYFFSNARVPFKGLFQKIAQMKQLRLLILCLLRTEDLEEAGVELARNCKLSYQIVTFVENC